MERALSEFVAHAQRLQSNQQESRGEKKVTQAHLLALFTPLVTLLEIDTSANFFVGLFDFVIMHSTQHYNTSPHARLVTLLVAEARARKRMKDVLEKPFECKYLIRPCWFVKALMSIVVHPVAEWDGFLNKGKGKDIIMKYTARK